MSFSDLFHLALFSQSLSMLLQMAGFPFSWQDYIPLWRRKWQITPVSLPGKSHGLRSPVG